MKRLIKVICCILLIFAITSFCGCNLFDNGTNKGGGANLNSTSSNRIAVSSISLNKNQLDLKVGESEILIATIYPTNANNKNIKWDCYNENIATVSSSGKVVAVKMGTTRIDAISEEDKTIYASCIVKVEGDYNLTFNYSTIPFTINYVGPGLYPYTSSITISSLTYNFNVIAYDNASTNYIQINLNMIAQTSGAFDLKYKVYDEQNIVKYSSSIMINSSERREVNLRMSLQYGTVPTSANFKVVFSAG